MRERHTTNHSFANRFDPVSQVGPQRGPTHRRTPALWIGVLDVCVQRAEGPSP
jgi:hypothetical protein